MKAGGGGLTVTKSERETFAGLFSASAADVPFEAAFLFKSTGIALAAWTRSPVPQEVLTVMAATMWGSLDTMIRTLGGEGPRYVLVEVEGRRILAMQVEPNWTLLLVAPRSLGKRRLRQEAQRILVRVRRARGKATARSAMVSVQH